MSELVNPEDREETTDLQSGMDLDKQTKDEPPRSFPKTLEGFGYAFNEQGQLRHVKTGERFVFKVREDDGDWNQKHYEALGEVLNQHVYELLEKKCNLTRVMVPVDATENEHSTFIFLSPDALTNPSKLMVLIQGLGAVRAGQWARKLIINEDLDSGTQIPFITRAMEEGYGVMVLNPNDNYLEVDEPTRSVKKNGKSQKTRIRTRENGSPSEHVLYVWDHFVSRAQAKDVFIVAHSYGGYAFVDLMKCRETEVKSRVVAVAFTDSVHSIRGQKSSQGVLNWMRKRCRNWVVSEEPLDTSEEPTELGDCPCVSAGTDMHDLTSWRSFRSVFSFFKKAPLKEDRRR